MADSSGDIRPKLDDVRRDLTSLRDDLDKLRAAGLNVAAGQVRDEPVKSLLVAFGVGLLLGVLKA
jgi:ElaB/YqjD/DUF883 family membrane-anchored ribosome-binding protein